MKVRRRVRLELLLLAVLIVCLAYVSRWAWGSSYGNGVYVTDAGKTIRVEYGSSTGTEIDVSLFTDPYVKTGGDLAVWVQIAWENQWGYVWGTFGNVLTMDEYASKLAQYPDNVGRYSSFILQNWIGRRTADCVGLIKSYGWYDPDTGSIEYGSNGMEDVDTEGMYEAATVKGEIDTLPETSGVIVYMPGHVGVYIGGGYVIESIGTEGGVVKTRLDGRGWTDWFQCPYITYY
ncbi:MAG: C40 family peptidase [Oscillospiraceae bacterium]|nr:C40 family peptidase [Oscillospiraceae bacterium]